MPLTMFALAAIPGSLLDRALRRRCVSPSSGLFIAALAAAARAAAFDVWTLYAATRADGLRRRDPAAGDADPGPRSGRRARIWLATAIYTNGMLIGVTLGLGADHSGGAAAGRRQAGGSIC